MQGHLYFEKFPNLHSVNVLALIKLCGVPPLGRHKVQRRKKVSQNVLLFHSFLWKHTLGTTEDFD